jgi:hypothetical protein
MHCANYSLSFFIIYVYLDKLLKLKLQQICDARPSATHLFKDNVLQTKRSVLETKKEVLGTKFALHQLLFELFCYKC